MSALGFAWTNPLAWLPVVGLASLLVGGLGLRGRAKAIPIVPTNKPVDLEREDREWLLAPGVNPDAATKAALADYATTAGLDVLDLVPPDLPVDAAFDLVRLVDPASYRRDRLAAGRGVGQGIAVTPGILARAGYTDPAARSGMEPAALLAATAALKKFAPASTGLAIVPGLHAGELGGRRARLIALGIPRGIALGAPAIGYAALVAGVVANPVWGVGTLVVYCLHPYLVFAGTPLSPRGLHVAALGRLVWGPYQWLRGAFGRRGPHATAETEARRARIAEARTVYAADIAAGVERFLEPPRTTCPWCGAGDLTRLLTAPDLFQGKPGRFRLDRCGACGHTFQNPRLTIEGLDFYYRDFYDGWGEDGMNLIWGMGNRTYRERAEILQGLVTAPRTWLDVGSGHGHFCSVAGEVWPGTAFDGLDMTEAIEEAERCGWVRHGFRGMFPELAPGLAGAYDVVSMSHYLEHTREPFDELDAAATALAAGGYLVIEVPDPEWPMGPVLKRYWFPWFQPQHQHMIPIANLKAALAERGFVPVAEGHTVPGSTVDFGGLIGSVYLLLWPLTRDRDTPWEPRPPAAPWKAIRALALAVQFPLLWAATIADRFLSIPLRRSGAGSAYRVVARRVAETAASPAPVAPAVASPSPDPAAAGMA